MQEDKKPGDALRKFMAVDRLAWLVILATVAGCLVSPLTATLLPTCALAIALLLALWKLRAGWGDLAVLIGIGFATAVLAPVTLAFLIALVSGFLLRLSEAPVKA